MATERVVSAAAIQSYLCSRSRLVRWPEWLRGRRYRVAALPECWPGPLRAERAPVVVVAHSFREAARARQMEVAIEQDWVSVPAECRVAYEEILCQAPGLMVLQLRRRNLCGCLGHRHVIVKEPPFAEAHEAFRGVAVGEIDIAYEAVEAWPALPLSDAALDAKFFEGSRLDEFREERFRLKLLSVFLHETNHLVLSQEPEESVRARSLAFYREALDRYVENAVATLSLTIDRSFSRLE